MWQKRSCTKVSITDVSNNACKINSVVRQAGFAKKKTQGKNLKNVLFLCFFRGRMEAILPVSLGGLWSRRIQLRLSQSST